MRGGLILVYDAESAPCRGLVDWIGTRDREGRVVAFPLQNAALAQVAPELAGQVRPREVLALDLRSRRLFRGPALVPEAFRRLPGWWLLAPAMRLPFLAALVYGRLLRPRQAP